MSKTQSTPAVTVDRSTYTVSVKQVISQLSRPIPRARLILSFISRASLTLLWGTLIEHKRGDTSEDIVRVLIISVEC